MALVKFLAILFIIYFIFKVFTRYILKTFLKNMQQNAENQKNQYTKKKEGDVTINTQAKGGKKIDKDEGDYVDYEEIKE